MSYDVCPFLPDVAQEYGCTTYTFEVPWSGCTSGRFHAGIDLWDSMNPNLDGQPVYATRNGTVFMIGFESTLEGHDFGPNAICLRCDDGTYLWYGHLSKCFITDGQKIYVGEVIGAIGSLGVSTGPHLHFEARISYPNPQNATEVVEGAIDPTPYLSFQLPSNTGDIMPAEIPSTPVLVSSPSVDITGRVNCSIVRLWVYLRNPAGENQGASITGRLVAIDADSGNPVTFTDFSVDGGHGFEWDLTTRKEVIVVVLQSTSGPVYTSFKVGTR